MKIMHITLSDQDHADLREAKRLLENPGIAIQIANLLGSPIEHLLAKQLPKRATALIDRAANTAVTTAFNAAMFTMRKDKPGASSRNWLQPTKQDDQIVWVTSSRWSSGSTRRLSSQVLPKAKEV